jgi:hypothetical protein
MRLEIVSLRFLRNGFFKVLLLAAFTIYVKPGEKRRFVGRCVNACPQCCNVAGGPIR